MDALSSLYPSYIFSLIMGFAPFKIQRDGPFVKIKYLRFYNLTSAFVYAIFICLLVGVTYYKLSFYRLQTPMQRFISFLYIVFVMGLLSVNVIFNKIHTSSLVTLWEKIHRIDVLIKNRRIQLDYKKMMYSILVFCVSGIIIHLFYIIFLVCIQKYKNLFFSGLIYFALNLAISSFVCVSCSFHAVFLVIGHMFEKVLENLENKLLKNVDLDFETKLKSLLDTATLHQELCEISRLANGVTSVQMLASFAVTFGLSILQIYSVVTAFNNNKVDYNFVGSSLACVVVLFREKLSISQVSRRCMGMIPKTKILLTRLLNVSVNEDKITREINAFNLQILHDQFEIKAGSFFEIDLPIFLTAGSAITAYIILFIQADPLVDLYQSMKETVGAI